MVRESTDILIAGGGVAGLIAAASFGAVGFRVTCIDPVAPVTAADAPGADLRTTAFLQPSVDLLDRVGLWPRLAPHATPLSTMRIVDAGGDTPAVRQMRDFTATDISDRPFAWNLPNWLLRRELLAQIAELPGVSFRAGIGVSGVLTRESAAIARLSDGTQVHARLLIAADGRTSPVREALGITVQTTRYGQKALVFAVGHDLPHDNISTEVHRSGGPFTLVPLPDQNSSPASAVVWMERGENAEHLLHLDESAFSAAATERSAGVLGRLALISPRSLWPIISQRAERCTAQRCVLIAEAAHVVPPIGAQGLNMSLADLASLLTLAEADRDGLGGAAMLAAHERRRHLDVRMRVAGIDLLNRASMADAQPLRDLRARALGALHDIPPLRRALMRAGLGIGKR